MALTLKDLARLAGVHPSTVARVLNGDPRQRVSAEVRERIVVLARQHGYQPTIRYCTALSALLCVTRSRVRNSANCLLQNGAAHERSRRR